MGDDATDPELLARANAGDAAAFEALVKRHAASLLRFATHMCGGETPGQDAAQDALLSAWRAAGGFRGEASVKTWLFQLAANACRRRHRRKEPEAAEVDDAARNVPVDAPPPDAVVASRELGATLARALAALPPESREVLFLRDVEGLSGDETAVALGLTLPAMKSRLHRARLELKSRVEAELGHGLREELS